MGVDISMAAGVGVHIPQNVIEEWAKNDPEEIGVYELMEEFIGQSRFRGLTFAWAGNAWIGEQFGFVIYVDRTVKDFDMGREAQAGVYKYDGRAITLDERNQLSGASQIIAGTQLPIEYLITVTVL